MYKMFKIHEKLVEEIDTSIARGTLIMPKKIMETPYVLVLRSRIAAYRKKRIIIYVNYTSLHTEIKDNFIWSTIL